MFPKMKILKQLSIVILVEYRHPDFYFIFIAGVYDVIFLNS